MKNKKLATLSVALGLSTIALIGGISAYFTDADTATNEFTIGKVSLDLQEPNFNETEAKNNITPNQVIKKDPQIKNDGINDEFVFLKVKVPVKNIVTAQLDGTKLPAADTELFSYTVKPGWYHLESEDEINGTSATRVYAYGSQDACTALAKGQSTPALFDTVKVCNAVEDQGLETTAQEIVVEAYGIQTTDINDGPDGTGDKKAPADVWAVLKKQAPSTTVTETEDAATDIKKPVEEP